MGLQAAGINVALVLKLSVILRHVCMLLLALLHEQLSSCSAVLIPFCCFCFARLPMDLPVSVDVDSYHLFVWPA